MKRFAIVMFLSCVGVAQLFGYTDTVKFTLDSCLRILLENNYEIKIVKEKQAIAENNVSWGAAGGLPVINAEVGGEGWVMSDYYTNVDGSKSKDVFGGNNAFVGTSVGVEWTIFDGMKVQTTYKQLKKFAEMGELSARIEIEKVVAEAVHLYYDIIRQKIKLNNLKVTLEQTKSRYKLAEEMHEKGGAGSLLEYQLAQVDYNSHNYDYEKQRTHLMTKYVKLKHILVLDDDMYFDVAVDTIDNSVLVLAEDYKKQMLEENLLVKYADMQTDISEMDLKIAKSGYYPFIKLNSRYAYASNWWNGNDVFQQHNLDYNIGLTIGINLFDGLNTKRAVRNARHKIEIDSLMRQNLKNMLVGELVNLMKSYSINMTLLNMEKKDISTAEEYYKSAEMRYNLGMLSGVDFKDAQSNLLMVKERISELEYESKNLEIAIYFLYGEVLERYLK